MLMEASTQVKESDFIHLQACFKDFKNFARSLIPKRFQGRLLLGLNIVEKVGRCSIIEPISTIRYHLTKKNTIFLSLKIFRSVPFCNITDQDRYYLKKATLNFELRLQISQESF